MTRSAASSKVLLVADRPRVPASSASPVRRYRLVRLRPEGRAVDATSRVRTP